MIEQLANNPVLIIGLLSWALAQFLKVPIEWALYKRRNWALWFASGGMPSSHSSLMTAVTLSSGLLYGFDTPYFALAFAIWMVVVYDATGVRREAGRHAERINVLVSELLDGKPISEEKLKEVIGHTPAQVVAGIALGVVMTVGFYLLWHYQII